MSVIDNLIFDRTQADVDRVFELKNKILTGEGFLPSPRRNRQNTWPE